MIPWPRSTLTTGSTCSPYLASSAFSCPKCSRASAKKSGKTAVIPSSASRLERPEQLTERLQIVPHLAGLLRILRGTCFQIRGQVGACKIARDVLCIVHPLCERAATPIKPFADDPLTH